MHNRSVISPPWVYDLIAAVARYEDEHAAGSDCLHAALAKVPAVERDRATAIAEYARQAPVGFVEVPAQFTDEQVERFKTEWDRRGGGPVGLRRHGGGGDA